MEQLPDDLLIAAYNYASHLELSPDFIGQLLFEMEKRGLKKPRITSTHRSV